ncbi:conserved hypothetical protein [Candidatus Nitrosymbiomonas proteolyticus]|uniref:KAP NTPase domain-containing protein n=1 Tax=Candidatus Nitrosymbiomonas proteolyticus TaxID=2608984 RepID=A0A809RXA1_9BACT|nr:conserved hypothetical protein [Candidatus Nitrosymbiomonas proteolyticus]
MVVERIASAASIVHFEPWMVTTKESLAAEFFAVLGQAVLPSGDKKQAQLARSRFYRYGSKIVGVLAVGAKAAGAIVPGASAAGEAATSISSALDLAADGLQARSTEPTLREMRQSISEDLSKLKKPIVVVIDDIDRLDLDEVRTTFQLIKACADFPNVRYLLLFDREQVFHALEGSVNNPQAFLEKIVNQVFDLPEATTKQRAKLLDDALSELGLHEGLPKQDMERLSIVFDEVLLPGLQTVRHVKRFVSTVRSLLPGVIVDSFRNIDPADFLALEFLRQYAPAVYAVLRDEQAPAPGGRVARMVHDEEWPQMVADRRQKAIDDLPEPTKALAKEALDSFSSASTSESAAHAACRFETDYWRPVYFGFCDARAKIKEADWMAFRSLLDSKKSLRSWLKQWDDRDLRDRWVTAICARATELSRLQRLKLMSALFMWGDAHGHEETSLLQFEQHEWSFAVSFCCTAMLEATRDPKQRIELLNQAIRDSAAMVAPSLVVGMEGERQRKDGWGHWAQREDLTGLIQDLGERMTGEVRSGGVWSHPDPEKSIHAWIYVAEKEKDAWFDNLPDDKHQLAKYLNHIVGSHMDDKNLSNWRVEKKLLQAVRDIDLSLLTEKGHWARQHLLDSAERLKRQDRFFESDENEEEETQAESEHPVNGDDS